MSTSDILLKVLPDSPATSSSPSDPLEDNPRLGIPFPWRLFAFSVISFTTGFGLGGAVGGTEASLRYRAENAHRLPTSSAGWYLYQKSKRYHAVVGGTKKGMGAGIRTTAWGMLYLVVEEGFDQWKGQRDFTSSAGAALTMAGLFSAMYHRGDVFTSARTAKIALVGGTTFGLLQDGFGWSRGHVPPYVRWLSKKFRNEQNIDWDNGARYLNEGDKI